MRSGNIARRRAMLAALSIPLIGREIESLSLQKVRWFARGRSRSFPCLQSPRTAPLRTTCLLGTPVSRLNEGSDPPSVDAIDESHQDSIAKFADDTATVLKKLRSDKSDPSIPLLFRRTSSPSFTRTWTLEDWRVHTSRSRYVTYLTSLPHSRLLSRTAPQLSILIGWSVLASWLCSRGVRVLVPLTPLSLVSTFVAALLTLRSNQGLSRLSEGRLALGNVVLHTREMAQLIAWNVYPIDKQLGLKAARHVALFPWLFKGFVRGDAVNGSDDDIIRTMLPAQKNDSSGAAGIGTCPISTDAAFLLAQRKKPIAVVARLRQIFAHLQSELTTSQTSWLDHNVHQLNHCVMVAERIQSSPIPPLYSAHTGRLLIFYLTFLPLALRGGDLMNGISTVITSVVVGYAMLGLDEISHVMEEPFRLMPLWDLSKVSMMDCADALVCRPPALFDNKEDAYPNSSDGAWLQQPPYC